MSHVRYEILLPLRYNDGTPVEDIKIEETRSDLLRRFQAVSFEPATIQGVWLHEQVQYEDTLVRLLVDVEDSAETAEFFQEFKEALKRRFDQIDIWIIAYPIRII